MAKYFFETEDSEMSYTKEHFFDIMRFDKIEEKEVFKAVPDRQQDFIYCKEFGVSDRGTCGRDCPSYDPRNGKSGICKIQGQLYTPGEKVTLKLPTTP